MNCFLLAGSWPVKWTPFVCSMAPTSLPASLCHLLGWAPWRLLFPCLLGNLSLDFFLELPGIQASTAVSRLSVVFLFPVRLPSWSNGFLVVPLSLSSTRVPGWCTCRQDISYLCPFLSYLWPHALAQGNPGDRCCSCATCCSSWWSRQRSPGRSVTFLCALSPKLSQQRASGCYLRSRAWW